jgi:hypothetical protein
MRSSVGTWIARAYDEDTGKHRLKALGDFGALSIKRGIGFALSRETHSAHAARYGLPAAAIFSGWH